MNTPETFDTPTGPQSNAPFDSFSDPENIDIIEAASGIGSWEWNLKSNLIHWTPETYRIFGRDPGTPLSVALIREWVHPEDRDSWEASYQNCLEGKGAFRKSFRVRLKDGPYRWVRAQGNLIRSESGEPSRLCGHIIDETDLREREQALSDIEKRMSQYEAIAKIGRWEWDVLNDKVTWSREIFRFFEVSPDGEAPPLAEQHKLFLPDEFERLNQALEQAVKVNKPYAIKLKRIASDGSQRVCLARGNIIRNEEGKVVKLWGYLEDITELEVIDQEREMLRVAIEQSDEMVLITDADEKIIYANPALEKKTGYSLSELRGQTPRVFKSEQHSAEFYEQMWAILKRGETWHGHLINRHRDDKLYTEEATITPVSDSSGKITHYIALKQDITEKLQQQKKIDETQKLESVGRLAGGVAHDFNNMLQIIIGHVEHAMKLSDPDNPLLSTLDSIGDVARRSGNLTAQLLAFAREQAAMPVDLCANEKLDALLKMLRRLLGEDITVCMDMPEEHLYMRIDPVQFDQIITNLCVNARDAIGKKGCICLSLEVVHADDLYCATHPEIEQGEYVGIFVDDNGSGIPEDVLEHIFEPFFTTKPKDEGTGLGLSTVHGIVKQNNGHIFVHSEVGKGTQFTMLFPRTGPPELEEADERGPMMDVEMTGTVMVVEDEPMILELNAICLRDLGLDVVSAGDPEEAINLAKRSDKLFDVLMTDVVMPKMNGHELAKEIQKIHPQVKVLYMSGYPADVVSRKGLLPDSTKFLRKPYSMEDLVAAMKALL